jgi:hypothetical protein
MLIVMEPMVRQDVKDTLVSIERGIGSMDTNGEDTMNADKEQSLGSVPLERTRIVEAMLRNYTATLRCKLTEDIALSLLRAAGSIESPVQTTM